MGAREREREWERERTGERGEATGCELVCLCVRLCARSFVRSFVRTRFGCVRVWGGMCVRARICACVRTGPGVNSPSGQTRGLWCCPVPSQLTFWSKNGCLVLPNAQSTHLLVKQGVFGAAQCPVDGAGGLGWRHAATVGGWGGGWVVGVILRVCCLLQEAGSRRQLRQVGVSPCSGQPPFFLLFFF